VPSLKAIRKRIASTKATQKITRALKMVAGARLTRAQQRILALRPYAVKTAEVTQSVARTMSASEANEDAPHPLLARRPERRALLVVLSGDRGLCGAFNTTINKNAERVWREKQAASVDVCFATLGRKGREYLTRRRGNIARDFPGIYDGLDLEKARLVTQWLVPNFEKGEFDSVYLVYNEFRSAITQRFALERLLPIAEVADIADRAPEARGAAQDKLPASELLYEPNQRALLERLVPMYVEISVYRALLDSQASFFGAQMTAMDAATRNAKEMIARLTLAYNRARQAAITKELMEIIGGAEALKD
jgi:F-type H+-transporting ATPase subunit gamma